MKYLASFYITLMQETYAKCAPKINERDAREYEKQIDFNIQSVLALMTEIDMELS